MTVYHVVLAAAAISVVVNVSYVVFGTPTMEVGLGISGVTVALAFHYLTGRGTRRDPQPQD